MFRSHRRAIVFPQAEHARLAGAIALAWRDRPPLPFESFVRGVADHDRGYGELDDDDLETVADDRWIEIQRRGFAPRGEDPVVDLVVALHVRRLVGEPRDPGFEAELPAILAAAGVDEEQAEAADGITNVCDRLAFLFPFEEPESGEVRGFDYTLDGRGAMTLDPWPLAVPRLVGLVTAYEADGYPARLVPVVVPFDLTRP
jgi:hypothetical protein